MGPNNTACCSSVRGDGNKQQHPQNPEERILISPLLGILLGCVEAGTDTADLSRLKESEFNKRLNIVIAAVWGLFSCILHDTCCGHIFCFPMHRSCMQFLLTTALQKLP